MSDKDLEGIDFFEEQPAAPEPEKKPVAPAPAAPTRPTRDTRPPPKTYKLTKADLLKLWRPIDISKFLAKLRGMDKKAPESQGFGWIINRGKTMNRDHPFGQVVSFINKFYEELI
jgi:hypothetical protein